MFLVYYEQSSRQRNAANYLEAWKCRLEFNRLENGKVRISTRGKFELHARQEMALMSNGL